MQVLEKNTKIPISRLKNWKENPRSILKEDLERLKKHIVKFGIYKPLLVCKKGKEYEVIGGNMRLQVLKTLGINEIDCWILKFKNIKEKIEVSLSDNDRAGYYNDQELAELIYPFKDDISLADFKVDLDVPNVDLGNVLGIFSGSPNEKELDENISTKCQCPKCGYEW